MALNLEIPQPTLAKPKITIFGVGGAGGNAINNMIRSNLEGVDFVAANTDAQSLNNALAPHKIQLGIVTTKGLGAGSFPDRGRAAAEENIEEIENLLEGNNMVFIAAGMGGGTGTGAAPVIAKLARERDILTVGVVTKPFHFEGKYRMEIALKGIEELKKFVDTLIVIPNQNLFRIANEQTTFESAFKMADDVLHAGVRGITDLITMPGLVNLDFADIRTIMTKMGKAMMGTGEAGGENRAIDACEAAISNPLLDDISIKGAKGVLVNMTGGPDMTLFEADLAVNTIRKEVDPNANIIFGSAFNEDMHGKIRISVVATGIDVDDFKNEAFKTQETQEASKFRVDLEKSPAKMQSKIDVEEYTTTKKTYFDPGISLEIDEEIEEAEEDQPILPLKKEEVVQVKKAPKISANPKIATKESFFENEEDEFRIENRKSLKKTEDKISSSKDSAKKTDSGFSLFNFMNNKKSENKKSSKFDFEDENEGEIAEKTRIKPDSRQAEIEKKKKDFFKSTVFDEEKEVESENNLEDDIVNVPAFFRRKK